MLKNQYENKMIKITLCNKCGAKMDGDPKGRQKCTNPACGQKLFKGEIPYKPQGGCGGCGKK